MQIPGAHPWSRVTGRSPECLHGWGAEVGAPGLPHPSDLSGHLPVAVLLTAARTPTALLADPAAPFTGQGRNRADKPRWRVGQDGVAGVPAGHWGRIPGGGGGGEGQGYAPEHVVLVAQDPRQPCAQTPSAGVRAAAAAL